MSGHYYYERIFVFCDLGNEARGLEGGVVNGSG